MALAGKSVIIAGANGTIGIGACTAFLQAGASVYALVRSDSSAAKLKSVTKPAGGDLHVLVADYGTEAGMATVSKSFPDKVDHVISSIGSWWQGGVPSEQPISEVSKVVNNMALTHYVLAKTLLPRMKKQDGSCFLFITGSAGQAVWDVKSCLTTIGAAALFGVSLAFRAEFRASPVRVNELRISARIVPDGSLGSDEVDTHSKLSNVAVGKHIVTIVSSDISDKVITVQHAEHLTQIFVAA